MRNQLILLGLLGLLVGSACKQVECAEGTIERNGSCEPANSQSDDAKCGPFTELVGDQCVPQFPPTECDPSTTMADVDPDTGVTTCIGMGGPTGCSGQIACPAGTSGTKQTICGQLYDFETDAGNPTKFAATGAMGTRCNPNAPTTEGPCSLGMVAYDAIAFGTNPQAATPLAVTDIYIDDCGRYKLTDISVPSGPFIGIGVDDANGSGGVNLGPTGVTVTAAIATPKQPMTATKDLEAYIVKPSTVMSWSTSAATNLLQTGVYAPLFRKHKVTDLASAMAFVPQEGVQVTLMGNPVTANDFYFTASMVTRTTIDPVAIVTGANGTVLVNNASVAQSVNWGGMGGLGAGCRWEPHAGASLPGIVFIQTFRKIDILGQTCMD